MPTVETLTKFSRVETATTQPVDKRYASWGHVILRLVCSVLPVAVVLIKWSSFSAIANKGVNSSSN